MAACWLSLLCILNVTVAPSPSPVTFQYLTLWLFQWEKLCYLDFDHCRTAQQNEQKQVINRSMKVMRIHIKRVAMCSVAMFGVLVVMAFVHDSYLFFGSGNTGSRSSNTLGRLFGVSKLEVDTVGKVPATLAVPEMAVDDSVWKNKALPLKEAENNEQAGGVAKDLKNNEQLNRRVVDSGDKGKVGEGNKIAPDMKEKKAENILEKEVVNNANGKEKVQKNSANKEGAVAGGEKNQAAGNTENVPYVHDWERDFGSEYFRGEKLADDMLAVTPPTFLPDYKNPCFYVKDPNGDIVLPGEVKVLMKCLPYFHLIGVDKSGTTDLWFRLTKHKQIVENSGVLGKETHWWSWRRFGFDIWVRNAPVRHFNWYIDHFDRPARLMRDTTEIRGNSTYHPVITGEGSPTVFWDFTGWDLLPQNKQKTPETAALTPHCIHHLQPQTKLLLVLRNPVDRMYSEYLFLDRFKSHHNISAALFHEGVQKSIAMYQDCVRIQHSTAACLYNKTLHMHLPVRIIVGMYSVWIKEWFKVFPREQILILRNEDYAADLPGHLTRVFGFLELSPLSQEETDKIVQRKRAFQRSDNEKAVGNMLPATRKLLTDFYASYNKELATLLADDRYLWQ